MLIKQRLPSWLNFMDSDLTYNRGGIEFCICFLVVSVNSNMIISWMFLKKEMAYILDSRKLMQHDIEMMYEHQIVSNSQKYDPAHGGLVTICSI